jgi:tetratricopeptide (TPR) repeat protein
MTIVPSLVLFAFLLVSCAPSPEAVKLSAPVAETKEMVFRRGHQLYVEQKYDSATIVLERAAGMDMKYTAPLADLAEMYYSIGMQEGEKTTQRMQTLRRSREYFGRIEALGSRDSDLLERLCELSDALDDDAAFLKYAKKNAEAYPYDRQYFNLGLAYFKVGDYTNVIKTQKEAVEKFASSPYVGSFYRQLGRGYMKVNRDQTAERTFVAGLQRVDGRIAELRKAGDNYRSMEEYRRLMDDKIGMLTSLKKLHQTYKAADKLEQVERQLKEASENRQ